MLFSVKDTETVVGGGVFFIEFEDGEQRFLGTKGLLVAHRSLGGIPEFFNLHIIKSAARLFNTDHISILAYKCSIIYSMNLKIGMLKF